MVVGLRLAGGGRSPSRHPGLDGRLIRRALRRRRGRPESRSGRRVRVRTSSRGDPRQLAAWTTFRPATDAALVAVGGALGLSAMAVSRSFVVLIVVALTLMGALSAAFPQLFTLARVVLGDGAAGRRSAPLLRSGWSLAWAVGPLLGAAVLARSGYPALLLAAAATLLLTAALTLTVPRPRTAAVNADRDEPSSRAKTPSARTDRLPLALLVAG